MFLRVDTPQGSDIVEGFCYQNEEGYEDRVKIDHSWIEISDECDPRDKFRMFISDIPKMILALQAVQAHTSK